MVWVIWVISWPTFRFRLCLRLSLIGICGIDIRYFGKIGRVDDDEEEEEDDDDEEWLTISSFIEIELLFELDCELVLAFLGGPCSVVVVVVVGVGSFFRLMTFLIFSFSLTTIVSIFFFVLLRCFGFSFWAFFFFSADELLLFALDPLSFSWSFDKSCFFFFFFFLSFFLSFFAFLFCSNFDHSLFFSS